MKNKILLIAIYINLFGFTFSVYAKPHEHTWDNGVITRMPTCTQPGEMSFTCKKCKEKNKQIIPKNAHLWDIGEIIENPTCSVVGLKIFTCKNCKETKGEFIKKNNNHPAEKEWTTDDNYHWHKTTCEHKKEIVDKAAHTWGNKTVDGIFITYTCSVCGEIKRNYRDLDDLGKFKFINEPKNASLKGGIYVQFGTYPQTIKQKDVEIDESISITQGGNIYYAGSDGEWYVKCVENVYDEHLNKYDYDENNVYFFDKFYLYSNGVKVRRLKENSTQYFKVEPIIWRIITNKYNGKALLLSEKILNSNVPYYVDLVENRTVKGKGFYEPSYKYSNVRAWLNGINNQFVVDGGKATKNDIDWTDKGFLQTAFTPNQQNIIAMTIIDNSEESTCDEYGFLIPQIPECNEVSEERIFLLSEREVTSMDYGFNRISYSGSQSDMKTTKCPTDYAKANRIEKGEQNNNRWMLRSAYYTNRVDDYYGRIIKGMFVMAVNAKGNANSAAEVKFSSLGIVPALTIELANIHTFSDSWETDDIYHWHKATCVHNDVVYEKTEHSWDTGKIVEKVNNGVCKKIFTCEICKKSTEILFSTEMVSLNELGAYKKIPEPDKVSLKGGEYVSFGTFPQAIKRNGIFVDESISIKQGGNTYYAGSDGEWYIKCIEDAHIFYTPYSYSDGTKVKRKVENSVRYFKVEPIIWRVLTDNYNGKKLLLSENVLVGGIQYYGGLTHYNTNVYKYSNVRAYLNGAQNQFIIDGSQPTKFDIDWTNKGFLQTAFTSEQQQKIVTTTIDNGYDYYDLTKYGDTKEKVFLLSSSEVRKSDFGFAEESYKHDPARIKTATDYVLANYSGASWRLRTKYIPSSYMGTVARTVYDLGYINNYTECESDDSVTVRNIGVAPALCIE